MTLRLRRLAIDIGFFPAPPTCSLGRTHLPARFVVYSQLFIGCRAHFLHIFTIGQRRRPWPRRLAPVLPRLLCRGKLHRTSVTTAQPSLLQRSLPDSVYVHAEPMPRLMGKSICIQAVKLVLLFQCTKFDLNTQGKLSSLRGRTPESWSLPPLSTKSPLQRGYASICQRAGTTEQCQNKPEFKRSSREEHLTPDAIWGFHQLQVRAENERCSNQHPAHPFSAPSCGLPF